MSETQIEKSLVQFLDVVDRAKGDRIPSLDWLCEDFSVCTLSMLRHLREYRRDL